MEYAKIIDILMHIIVILVMISQSGTLFQRLKKRRPAEKPINKTAQFHKIPLNTSDQKNLYRKPWLVGLLLLLCIAYVLPEVIIPGELTRMALYKIVIGVGLFFFILIQSSISNVVETIYSFKSADLELIKSFLKKFKTRDD